MSTKTAIHILLGTFAGVLATLFLLTALLVKNGERLAETEHRHYESSKLANELRQSSDDLTRMARTYVVTGDPFFKACFDSVLAIRNGKEPRPLDYTGVYWDLFLADRAKKTAGGPRIPLVELMRDQEFAPRELGMLRASQEGSNELVRIEEIALNALEGAFDDGTGKFSIRKQPDPAMSRQLMFGKEYHAAKAKIMSPIGEVLELLDERRENELGALHRQSDLYERLSQILILFGLVVVLFASVLSWRTAGPSARTPDSTQVTRRKIFVASITTTAVIAITVSAITMYFLYTAAFQQKTDSLAQLVGSQVRLMEAIARFDRQHSQDAHAEGAAAATLQQIVWAHQGSHGLGRTGETQIASLEKGYIKYLLEHRHPASSLIPLEGNELSQAMRRALSGGTGTHVGADYRGEQVLAAYQPIGRGLNVGIVAKVDVAEIRDPFVTAGLIAAVSAILCVIAGAFGTVRLLSPLVHRIEEGEANLTSILGAAAEGIVSVDGDKRIQAINPAGERMFGYPPGELLGRPVRDLFAKLAVGETIDAILQVTGDYSGRRMDGSTFVMELSLSEVEKDGEENPGYIAVARDITQRKAAERHLYEARDAAEAANRAKSTFLSNMSHELRTPLNGVLGYAQILLRDQALTTRQEKNLAGIESCGQHLLALINNVLDLSKIESGKLEIELAPSDLKKLLGEVGDIIRQQAESNGLSYELQVDPTLPQAIRTDARKLRQVLVNLLENAVKFTPAGSVSLSVKPGSPGHVLFEIRDTGDGIDPKRQLEIFDPFKQAEAGKREGGTGLGLAISKRLIEALEGQLTLASQIGVGSCFTIRLPLEAASLPQPSTERADHTWRDPVLPAGRTIEILVVDDQPENRDVLVQTLEATGFKTAQASDGAEAIRLLRTGQYPLVLMDVRMPGMGGDEATRVIKGEPGLAATTVIAVTASVLGSDREELMAAGFDDFLPKPVQLDTLFATLAQHLDLSFVERGVSSVRSKEAMAETVISEPRLEADGVVDPTLPGRLRDLAELGDFTGLEALVQELGESSLGSRTSQLVQAFDFDGISALADELDAQRGS